MNNQAFTPQGSTYLVGTTAVQVPIPQGQTQLTAYRIRCLVAGYIAWSPVVSSAIAPTNFAANTPTGAGVPNTMGMGVGQVEVFCLPQSAWFISSVAAGFEITAGEGL